MHVLLDSDAVVELAGVITMINRKPIGYVNTKMMKGVYEYFL